MLIHNVYFWLEHGTGESKKEEFEKGLKDLVSAVGVIQKAEIGVPGLTPDREVVDHSFAYSLFIWFKSVEDHDIYQKHPAHDKFVSDFKGLWDRVHVFDSWVV